MWTIRLFLMLIVLVLIGGGVTAQDDDEDGDLPPLLTYGEVITGRLDNFTPSTTYRFEALRGDFISIRVQPISGNLDPLLVVLDASGMPIISRDDSRGSLQAYQESLLIGTSGTYSLVVARFGYGLGTTVGEYELTVERIGNSSASGSVLRYGDTVLNTITDSEPEFFYSFRANEGDIVNLSMQRSSGELDPYLQVVHIVNGQALVLEESDDTPDSLDAFIDGLIIPATATYYIVATRFGLEAGESSGGFLLSIDEAANSGLGNTPQTAARLRLGNTVEGELDSATFQRFYRFEAQQDDIITVRMSQLSGTLDTYIIVTNAGLQPLIEDDDSGTGRNSLIQDYIIPADGTYYIIATRYQGEDGTSTGAFRLQLEDNGNAFDDVPTNIPRLSYNLSVTGSIDDVTPAVQYAFYGLAGDVVTITLNRGDGDLDPFVRLLDADQNTLISDDDGGGNLSARIEQYTLPENAIYYVVAERFNGTGAPPTSGSYVLVLALVSRPEPTPTPVP